MFITFQGEKQFLHIAVDWISYEFINRRLPMQRMCPENEMGGSHCNQEALAMLKKLIQTATLQIHCGRDWKIQEYRRQLITLSFLSV